jgi:galactonate dehydratase
VHLDAAIPNFIIQEVFPYRTGETAELVAETYEERIEDGFLPVPDAPGLGIRLNEDVLSRYPRVTVP